MRSQTYAERTTRVCDGCGLSLVNNPTRARCVFGCGAWYHRPSSRHHPDCAEAHARRCPLVRS